MVSGYHGSAYLWYHAIEMYWPRFGEVDIITTIKGCDGKSIRVSFEQPKVEWGHVFHRAWRNGEQLRLCINETDND